MPRPRRVKNSGDGLVHRVGRRTTAHADQRKRSPARHRPKKRSSRPAQRISTAGAADSPPALGTLKDAAFTTKDDGPVRLGDHSKRAAIRHRTPTPSVDPPGYVTRSVSRHAPNRSQARERRPKRIPSASRTIKKGADLSALLSKDTCIGVGTPFVCDPS